VVLENGERGSRRSTGRRRRSKSSERYGKDRPVGSEDQEGIEPAPPEEPAPGPGRDINHRIEDLRDRLDQAQAELSTSAVTPPARPVTSGRPAAPAGTAGDGPFVRVAVRRLARMWWILLAALIAVVVVTVVTLRSSGKRETTTPPRTPATSPSSAVSVATTGVPATAVAPPRAPPTSAPGPTTTTLGPPTSVRPVPASRPPSGAAPPAPLAPPAPGAPVRIFVVARGDSFWSLAREVAVAEFGRSAGRADIDMVWLALVRANVSHLADPRNPNLIYSGQVFSLPQP